LDKLFATHRNVIHCPNLGRDLYVEKALRVQKGDCKIKYLTLWQSLKIGYYDRNLKYIIFGSKL